MNIDIDGILTRARLAGGAADGATAREGGPAAERARLERLASEFESLLMGQMLRDMRRAGQWDEDGREDDGFGATPLFEMIDAELATQMSRVQGLGLTRQLLDAFDRVHGTPVGAGAPGGVGVAHDEAGDLAVHAAAVGAGSHRPAITSAFGWRADPFTGREQFHRGVDLRAAYGEAVTLADAGRVVFSGSQGGYGTTVLVAHADGTQTRYAHLSEALVQVGETISAGQTIGRVGSSGRATGPHLHLERLDREGRPFDPLGDRSR